MLDFDHGPLLKKIPITIDGEARGNQAFSGRMDAPPVDFAFRYFISLRADASKKGFAMEKRSLLNVKSLKEQVYEYLREQLRTGVIKPGSVIDMETTSKMLGVSKTPLRDALLQLEFEGFVTILPRRKIVVNTLTLQDIRNYYEIIGALESAAILAAIDNFKEADLKALERLNAEMKEALERDDFDLYYEKNLKFHNTYLGLNGNVNLVRTVNAMKKRLYDFPRQAGFVKEWEEASIGEHAELVRLFRQRNKKEAAAFIRDVHWSFKVQEEYIARYYTKAVAAAD
jgi:DNA-binding GntR family transcriptional regulator